MESNTVVFINATCNAFAPDDSFLQSHEQHGRGE